MDFKQFGGRIMSEIENIDYLCAKYGHLIITEAEIKDNKAKNEADSYLSKALGVLQEQGIYAFYLFLEYRKDKKAMKEVKDQTQELLYKELKLLNETESKTNNPFEKAKKISQDLDKLLFARQVLEQTLIYARYHVKALKY